MLIDVSLDGPFVVVYVSSPRSAKIVTVQKSTTTVDAATHEPPVIGTAQRVAFVNVI